MALRQNRRAVGVFSNRHDAEIALRELRDSGFPMDRVSVITQDADRRDEIAGADVSGDVRERADKAADKTKADEGTKTGAIAGGALGGITGLLVGLGTLAIPGIGPIMLAGATATALATTLAGTAIGAAAGSLLGGLIGLGIPEERARVYNDRVSRGGYLIIVEGTDDEIHRAEAILRNRGIEEWGVYDHPHGDRPLVHRRRAIGVFPNLPDAEAALRDLRDSGFPLSQVSLVAREYDRRNHIPGIHIHDRFDHDRFGFLGDRFRPFHDRFNRGEYLVIVDGTEDEIRRAEAIMNRHRIHDWGIFDVRDDDRYSRAYATAGTHRPGTGRRYRGVGVFPHRRNAEAAIHELRNAGFPMDRLSVVGKHSGDDSIAGVEMHDRATGNKADEGAKGGAAAGAALGGLGGLLVGLGALAIPGIGPVIAGGALATALATTAAGGAIGAAAGGLTGALIGLGIPEERARFYNDRVNRGDYLVMLDGDEAELRGYEPILARHGVQDWGLYDTGDVAPGHDRTPDVHRDRTDYVATPGTHHPGVGRRHRAVGMFPNRASAEAALRDLRDSGFSMNQVSLVGKHTDGTHAGDITDRTKVDEGAKGGAATGAALGGLGGLLVGLGALAIPGIGPVIAGGALATALATTAAGGAIGAAAGGLTGALVGLGIPDDRARHYNDRVNRGDYLVMVDGTEDEIRRADTILNRHHVQDWGVFDAPSGDRTHHDTTTTATRTTIDPDVTPGTPHRDREIVTDHPDVVIIDHRDQTL
jgi:hypothetical protein